MTAIYSVPVKNIAKVLRTYQNCSTNYIQRSQFMNDPNYYVIVTGWNCAKYVQNCMASLKQQTYNKFTALVISDGSTDNTANAIKAYMPLDIRFSSWIYPENKFAAFRRYEAIASLKIDPEDVIICMDLDDQLHSNALEV